MKDWEKFEISCTGYLNSSFGKYAQFIHTGGSDSTKPDIAVVLNNGKRFYMEAKKCPAQCGQFVLIPDIKKRIFKYSDGNSEPLNFNSEAIIKHMNNFFDELEIGTTYKDMPPQKYTLNSIAEYSELQGKCFETCLQELKVQQTERRIK